MSRKKKRDPYAAQREADELRKRFRRLSGYDPKRMEVRAPLGCVILGVLFAIGVCWVIFRLAFQAVY